ncbi:MAG: hypothetical protein LBT89_12660 [Planctomycetaceae bacterium]|nr:hypothetical protein [Planctomycetaceae bacterium]
MVFRFNRLYIAVNRKDFIYSGNELGTPRQHCGIPIRDNEASKKLISDVLLQLSPNSSYVAIIVYTDSFDRFYVIRDLIVKSGFQYELKPSLPETIWSFGSSERGQVQ